MNKVWASNYYTPKHFIDGLKLAIGKLPELKNNIEACFIGISLKSIKSISSYRTRRRGKYRWLCRTLCMHKIPGRQ